MMEFNSPNELLEYMKKEISYGWIDKNKNRNLDTLKNFRSDYITMKISEILSMKIGTCIEQSLLQKLFLEKMNYYVEMYTLRSFELERETDEKVRMHCFTIYENNNRWYHFEHANPDLVGIHQYSTKEEAIKEILTYFRNRDKGEERRLNKVDQIPGELSFEKLNAYLNQLEQITDYQVGDKKVNIIK